MWVQIENNEIVKIIENEQITLNENNYSYKTWSTWDPVDLAAQGIYMAVYDDVAPTRFHHTNNSIDSFYIEDNVVKIYRVWLAVDINVAKTKSFDILASWRYEKEEGGTLWGEIPLATDRITQSKIMAAYIKASEDPEFTIPNWKFAPNTFVTLSSSDIITIGNLIISHVQSCFDVEAEISVLIDQAETVEDLEDILNEYLV